MNVNLCHVHEHFPPLYPLKRRSKQFQNPIADKKFPGMGICFQMDLNDPYMGYRFLWHWLNHPAWWIIYIYWDIITKQFIFIHKSVQFLLYEYTTHIIGQMKGGWFSPFKKYIFKEYWSRPNFAPHTQSLYAKSNKNYIIPDIRLDST